MSSGGRGRSHHSFVDEGSQLLDHLARLRESQVDHYGPGVDQVRPDPEVDIDPIVTRPLGQAH
jgi:hypothetical protein